MSHGFLKSNCSKMKGLSPQKSALSLIRNTNWGNLDYLIIDFPSGTGDIQFAIGREIKLTASIIVTNSSKVTNDQLYRGVSLFKYVKVPTVAIVENTILS